MFVTDGTPNMQHTEFTEDLRDDGLEPWQPVVANWPNGFPGTVPGVLRASVADAPTETNWTPVVRARGIKFE